MLHHPDKKVDAYLRFYIPSKLKIMNQAFKFVAETSTYL